MMTKQQIQRQANTTARACWYATGDGGGWWIQPDQKAIKRNARRRANDQAMRDIGMVKVRGALGGTSPRHVQELHANHAALLAECRRLQADNAKLRKALVAIKDQPIRDHNREAVAYGMVETARAALKETP